MIKYPEDLWWLLLPQIVYEQYLEKQSIRVSNIVHSSPNLRIL